MNPTLIIGTITSLIGMTTNVVTQGANIHRQLNPPAQVAQAPGRCVPPYQPTVIIENGVRRVVCAEQVQP